MRLFQTTTNDFQKMFQNDPWLFNINTCMLQDKVYPSKLLIQHNLHSISDYLTQNMLESVPSATAGHSSGIYCGQKSVYATTKPNKSARPSLALDSTFLFFYPSCFWPRESTIFSYFRLRCVLLGHIPDIPVIWT